MSALFVMHVLGSHGAGKSSLLQTLCTLAPAQVEATGFHNVPFTWLSTFQLAMVGDYTRHPPRGMDQLRGKVSGMATKPHQLAALDATIASCPMAKAVIWEGVAMQHMGFQAEYAARQLPVAYVFLDVPLETCFERIVARGGKTRAEMVGQGRSVIDKHRSVLSAVAKLRACGSTVWEFDGRLPVSVIAHGLLQFANLQPRVVKRVSMTR